ncbi:receptor-like protein EIX1 [Silene latifolia]|uniref:receptor-like protein EIX1 n=1 Tax=Silene latifolia TaxID=37657 RepID=UPI003D7720CD
MKPFYHLIIILLSWLVLSPCTCHPSLDRNRSKTQCIDSEREALLQFKHGIIIDNCGLLSSWEGHTDCCQWRGVLCSNQTGHVVNLALVREHNLNVLPCLEGIVSPSLGELKHLKHLNLSNNKLFGELPHQLGNLSELITLDLRPLYSNFNIQSLSWITRLRLLKYLDLSGMKLSQVTNWMTIVNNLPSLSVLRMDNCELSTEIPSSLSYVNSSATLHSISLSGNNFNDSSIFQWLFNLPGIGTRLVYLDLSKNAFQLPISTKFGNFLALSYLSLSDNGFQGNISKILSKLCNLRQLYLGNNHFTDDIADVIGTIVNCENQALLTLDLSLNSFGGTIPDSISSFSSLSELYLNNNQLKGEISQGIGQLTVLEKLDVSFNSLEGTLTHSHFLNLEKLRELSLSNNKKLVIDVDENWIPPFHLDVVNLRSCQLGPQFPKWLQLQSNYSIFDVSNTGIAHNLVLDFDIG